MHSYARLLFKLVSGVGRSQLETQAPGMTNTIKISVDNADYSALEATCNKAGSAKTGACHMPMETNFEGKFSCISSEWNCLKCRA